MNENNTAANKSEPDAGVGTTGNGIRQIDLKGLDAETAAHDPQPGDCDGVTQASVRAFVPSNRELVIEQLAAMVLSPNFPLPSGTAQAMVRPPFLVPDGLSIQEIDDLAAGQPQRFPVLVEVRPEAVRGNCGVIGVRDVLGLCFRSQAEVDDFCCLPFDELDTSFFPCEAEPVLFALASPVRPNNVDAIAASDAYVRGDIADRLAGAVCCLLELGAAESACWPAIADLLCASPPASQASGLELRTLISSPNGTPVDVGDAVARTFMVCQREAPGRLIEQVAKRVAQSSPDPTLTPTVARWLEVAQGVLGNRMALNGEILSDSGSIPLRAAILAAVVDDVGNLVPFLLAERPAGRKVVASAALLLGLRTGLRNLSWSRKSPQLDLLSDLLVGLHDERVGERVSAVDAFGLEPEEASSGVELLLCWRSQVLARWPAFIAAAESATDVSDRSPGQTADMAAPEKGERRAEPSNCMPSLIVGPNGRQIEVIRAVADSAMITLCVVLEAGEKLRKAKEIFEAASRPGIGWRVGLAEDASNVLYMDVPAVGGERAVRDAADTLSVALANYVVPPKAPRKRKAPTAKARKKTGEHT